jgi:hypothetical protein
MLKPRQGTSEKVHTCGQKQQALNTLTEAVIESSNRNQFERKQTGSSKSSPTVIRMHQNQCTATQEVADLP